MAIVQESAYHLPWLPTCVMNMQAIRLIMHQRKNKCNWVTEMRLRRRGVEIYKRPGEMKFGLYDREDDPLIAGVKKFK